MKKAIIPSIIILFFSCFLQQVLHAVPAYPKPVTFTQPDGTTIEVTIKGDEKVKWAVTSDGYTVLFNNKGFFEYANLDTKGDLIVTGMIASDPEKRRLKEKSFLSDKKKELRYSPKQISALKSTWEVKSLTIQKAFPKTGSQKLICILIGFTDLAFSKSQSDFTALFNQTSYTIDGATGSVRDYYSEVSYGQLDLTVNIAGPYTASHDMSYYGENNDVGNDVNPRALITEAINLADKDVNFSDYDNDHDGIVDGVYIIYAGHGEEAGASDDAIWAHAWSISPVTLDGVTISRYSCSAELRGNTGSNLTRIGVICHEFGHVLGAPDFYDIDYSGSGGNFRGTGRWDIMASGSWNNNGATPAHHNAFTKTNIYHWADATNLVSGTTDTLKNAVFNPGDFYRFNTTTPGEYYLMENRCQLGFDAEIPGEGLIIYHVHSDVLNSGNQINVGHPQKMYPVCANSSSNPGSSPASYGNINSSECPFPGAGNVSSFTDMAAPASKSWSGENTNQPLTNIVFHSADNTVTFDFLGGNSGDQGEDCSNAVILAGNIGSKNSTTTGFHDDYSSSCETSGEDRVYYLGTPVKSGGTLEIWTTDTDYDVVLYARSGSCTGTEIGCMNDPDSEILLWENTTGMDQNIWIFVDGNEESNGNTTLNWHITQAIPPGEDCENPQIISGTSGRFDYTTTGYNNDFSGDCGGSAEDVVFYLETPIPPGSNIVFWTSADNYDVVLYGRYGSCTGTEIACVDDPDGTVLSWENTTQTEQNIWIIADGYDQSNGSAVLNWEVSTPEESGENCGNPIIITGNSGSVEYSTEGYADNYTGICESTGGDIVYFLDTPVPDGYTLKLWTSEENYNACIYGKYESCDGPEIGCFNEKGESALSWENKTGSNQGVWIIADGFDGSRGTAILHWEVITIIIGLNEITDESSINLYPNPASDHVMLKISNNDVSIKSVNVYSIIGSLIESIHIANPFLNEFALDISGFAIGTYIVEVHLFDGVVRKKIEVIR